MVDPIGAKPSVAGDRSVVRPVSRVAAATPATVVQTPAGDPAPTDTGTGAAASAPAAIGLATSMAASPPVNKSRVAEIKAAIASGTFPILPATIADRLVALSLAWNSNEKA